MVGLLEAKGMNVQSIPARGIESGDGAQISNGLYVSPGLESEVQPASQSYFVRAFDTKQLAEDDTRVLPSHVAQETDYILYLSKKLPYQE